jgi:hypothetical protein
MMDATHAETIFHTEAWSRVLHDSYGFESVRLPSGGGHAAVCLPIMEVNSCLTGRRGISLPFTDSVPGIGNQAAIEAAIEAIRCHGRARRWKRLQLRGGLPFGPDATPSATYYEHVLNLRPEPDALLAQCTSSTRRAIRKGEQSGVEIEIGTDRTALHAFMRLNVQTRRKHGLPPQPTRFFDQLKRHMLDADQGFIVWARQEQVPVAAAVFLLHGAHAVFKYGASDPRQQASRAGNEVMWRGICRCRDRGCMALSLGRTDLRNEGLRRYKLGWGATESLLHYYTWSFAQAALITDPDHLHGAHNRLFRHLPPALAQLTGNMLYRHVP